MGVGWLSVPAAIRAAGQLAAALKEVRRGGHAAISRELESVITGVAAPRGEFAGRAVAAENVAAVGPSVRPPARAVWGKSGRAGQQAQGAGGGELHGQRPLAARAAGQACSGREVRRPLGAQERQHGLHGRFRGGELSRPQRRA